jgi:hypothetical protein
MKKFSLVFLTAGLFGVASAAAADAPPPPDLKLIAVRQAAHVPLLVQMVRSVELSTIDADAQAKLKGLLDPLVEKEQKLVADAKDHPDRADHDVKEATLTFDEGMKTVKAAVAPGDRPKLVESGKQVAGEALLLTGSWPVAGHPDPMPDLIKAVGLTDDQAAALHAARDEALKAKAAALDEQTAVMMAANGKPVDSKMWTDETSALGTTAVVKFRATLTAEQQEKWDRQVRTVFPPTRRSRG